MIGKLGQIKWSYLDIPGIKLSIRYERKILCELKGGIKNFGRFQRGGHQNFKLHYPPFDLRDAEPDAEIGSHTPSNLKLRLCQKVENTVHKDSCFRRLLMKELRTSKT